MQTDQHALTEGVIWKKLLLFALPILLGNIFQQLYNTADALIVGRFMDKAALAAVTSSGSLIFMLVGFFNGIALGAGVVISKFYGAKDERGIRLAVHTDIAFGLVAGIVLTVLGVCFTPTILRWMGTPENVLPKSVEYFRIYFMGAIFVVLYNICVGILQAVGDSKHPLYYLICSSLLNVVLDLLFIGGFGWGVWSAALATTISQGVSVALCLYRLMKYQTPYQLHIKHIRFHVPTLKNIIRLGLPSGVQNSIIAFANLVVQSNINSFGDAAMAGCGSYSKVEGFAFLPITCFAMALSTFVGQNLGAKQYDRVKKCLFVSVAMVVGYTAFSSTLLIIFGNNIIGIFSSDPNVLKYGMMMLMHMAPFYFMVGVDNVLAGNIRGVGKTMMSMIFFVANLCGVRVLWIGIMLPIFRDINIVFWGYPVSWLTCLICMVIYLFRVKWLKESF